MSEYCYFNVSSNFVLLYCSITKKLLKNVLVFLLGLIFKLTLMIKLGLWLYYCIIKTKNKTQTNSGAQPAKP